jgi:glycosyltransferase involved in cell wall biosynthesis
MKALRPTLRWAPVPWRRSDSTDPQVEPDVTVADEPVAFRPCAVVPCYNHHTHVNAVVKALRDADLPVVIVDDGSDELTSHVLSRISTGTECVTLIRHQSNKGKGAAVKSGLWWAARSGFTHIVQIDADGQHALCDVSRFLRMAEENPRSIIAGVPLFDSSAPFVRKWGRLFSVIVVWLETRSRAVRDPLCGFRVYPVQPALRVISRTKIGNRMEFDPEILVRMMWAGVPVRSLETRVIYPAGNSSNFRYVQDNLTMVVLHARLLTRSLFRLRG